MEAITTHPMFTEAAFFILGMLGSMAAFGAGLGAFLTSRALANLLNKLSGATVSQNTAWIESAVAKREIQKNKETPCGQKCKHYAKKGTCKDNCKISAKLEEIKNTATANIKQNVSQKDPRAPEISGQNEIQNQKNDTDKQPGEGFLGGDNDCYSYCKVYNETGNCMPGCPMINN